MSAEQTRRPHARNQLLLLGVAFAALIPGVTLRFVSIDLPHPVEAAVFGLVIVAAAFILSWGAEVAQLDISAGLSIAVLAFIAVLPEYAVDFVFAWQGGEAHSKFGASCLAPGSTQESPCALALANMTGANRLLIGVGWSLVVLVASYRFLRTKSPKSASGVSSDGIQLEKSHSIEIGFLTLASLFAMTLPLKHSITIVDAAVLIGIFVAYTIRIIGAPAEEPDLVGPAKVIGELPIGLRRTTVIGFLIVAAGAIIACAEPFAHALVASGENLGVSEFLLVQWVAPLASEAPELLVALLFAWRLNANSALGTLVSSKVNQWTLLVGSLPIVFAISAGKITGLPITGGQRHELLLTGAQSLFAIAILLDLRLSVKEALTLLGLFVSQFIIGILVGESNKGLELEIVSGIYLIAALLLFIARRERVKTLMQRAFKATHEELFTPGVDVPGT